MSSLKQNVMEFLAEQPEDVTSDELIEFIYIHRKLSEAEKSIQEGKYYSLEQAKEMLEKWRE
jgi:hypothetical protein